jgi:hypothetical protein
MSFLKNYYVALMKFIPTDVSYGLKSKNYCVAGMTNEQKSSGEFYDTLPPL